MQQRAIAQRCPPALRRRVDVMTVEVIGEADGAYCGQTGFACETLATLASRSCTTNSKTARTCASSTPSNHSTKSWTVAPSARLPKRADTGSLRALEHPSSAEPCRARFRPPGTCSSSSCGHLAFDCQLFDRSRRCHRGLRPGRPPVGRSLLSGPGRRPSSGSCAAAARTSSLPVTTSAMNRVRYSWSNSIWRRARCDLRTVVVDRCQTLVNVHRRLAACSCRGGQGVEHLLEVLPIVQASCRSLTMPREYLLKLRP